MELVADVKGVGRGSLVQGLQLSGDVGQQPTLVFIEAQLINPDCVAF